MTDQLSSNKLIDLSPVLLVQITCETCIFLAFLGLSIWYMKSSNDKRSVLLPPNELVAQADDAFNNQNMSLALLKYWQGVQAMENQSKESRGWLLHAHVRISDIYFQSGWVEDSFQHLEKASNIAPDNIIIHLLKGKLYIDQGERALAVEAFLKVLQQSNNNPEAHYQLGILYQGANQFDLAINHYQQAINSDVDLKSSANTPIAYGLLSRLQLARTYSRKSQKLQYSDQTLTDRQIQNLNQMTDSALQLLVEAVDLSPNFVEAKQELISRLYGQASALERGQGDMRLYDQALLVYQQIVSLDPEEIDAWLSMGQIYRSFLEETDSALEAFKVAYSLDPRTDTLAEIRTLEEELSLEINNKN